LADQTPSDAQVRVQKSFVHPAAPAGAPVLVSAFNLVFAGVTVAILHWWPGLAICVLIQATFAWFGRKGPFYLRYMLRNYWRPILYLDN
jgi:type IV secretory pathway TrbD component